MDKRKIKCVAMLIAMFFCIGIAFYAGCSYNVNDDMVINSISFDEPVVDQFFYSDKSDGTICVSRYIGAGYPDFYIPEVIDGKTVSEIGSMAFMSFHATSITVPETVTKIGSYAFADSPGLETIVFDGNSQLEEIGSSAFYNCTSLNSLSLPSGVETINDMAFAGCSALFGTFVIPSGVTKIEAAAFAGCNGITAFSLSSANTNYIVLDGVLYSKEGSSVGSKLLAYPGGKTDTTFSLPSEVTEIPEFAIYNNAYINTVNLSNVITILQSGLKDCTNLTEIYGSNVERVDTNALEGTMWLNNNTNDYVSLGNVLLMYQGNESIVDVSAYSTVGDFAFAMNSNIVQVITGRKTETFGQGAFFGCGNLEKVTLLNLIHPVYISDYTFGGNADEFEISIPQSMLFMYATSFNKSGWSNYNDYFTLIKTAVSFNSLGGSSCGNTVEYYGSAVNLPSPTRDGYTFEGWYTSVSNGIASGQKINGDRLWLETTSNVTLYAKWSSAKYIVTLDYDNGTGQGQSVEVTYLSEMPSLTAPTRTGYTFGGYYTQPNGEGTQYYSENMAGSVWNMTNAATLYAKWM